MTTAPPHGLHVAPQPRRSTTAGKMRNDARPGPNRTPAAGLGVLALFLSGLSDGAPHGVGIGQTVLPPAAANPSAALPEQIMGVWYRDNPHDSDQCARHHAAPELDVNQDEGSIAMIGSIVVTPGLIHQYAEYGEGNYNAVRRVVRVAESLWRVDVDVGLDVLPDDDGYHTPETYRLEITPGGLIWTPWHTPDESPTLYFRCGAVREDLYGPWD